VEKRKTIFVVNPRAGSGSTGHAWGEIDRQARERLGDFYTAFTTGPGGMRRESFGTPCATGRSKRDAKFLRP